MKDLWSGVLGVAFFIVFLLGQFPGGTIIMAMSCSRLTGWDWVFSVIIPFYGLLKVIFSSAC